MRRISNQYEAVTQIINRMTLHEGEKLTLTYVNHLRAPAA